eukprot:TRINITY_DN100396_c0_g1_i1.p1 TRINITY_DN100396_c0_g1~~TRINITY_DN100396_c0_g1_i1.p1  ORF type:complete len:333 (-),score=70.46 TRINITY_DN100396_c0_g1_i1:20-1018(-)
MRRPWLQCLLASCAAWAALRLAASWQFVQPLQCCAEGRRWAAKSALFAEQALPRPQRRLASKPRAASSPSSRSSWAADVKPSSHPDDNDSKSQGSASPRRSPRRPPPRRYSLGDIWHFSKEGNVAQAEVALRAQEAGTPEKQRRMLFNTAIKAAELANDFDQAWAYYEEMIAKNIQPSSRTFGKLLDAAVRAGDNEAVAHVLKVQREAGFQVSEVQLTILLKAASEQGDLEAAERWARYFESAGVLKIQTHTYNVLIRTAVEQENLESMEYWLKRMIDEGAQILSATCSAVVQGYIKAGKPALAERWFDWGIETGTMTREKSRGRRPPSRRR